MDLYETRSRETVAEITWDFCNVIRGHFRNVVEQMALAYAFYLVRDKYEAKPDFAAVLLEAKENIFIQSFLEDSLSKEFDRIDPNLYRRFDKEDFGEIFLSLATQDDRIGPKDENYCTPDSILDLGKAILDVKESERVMDLGTGRGKFVFSASKDVPNATYVGVDYNLSRYTCAEMIKSVLKSEVALTNENIFSLSEQGQEYDKVFADLPFAINRNSSGGEAEYSKKLSKDEPAFSKCAKLDWFYCAIVMDLLSKNGRAAVMLPNGTMYNAIDQKVREYFIRKGFIEALIFLPGRMYDGTNIPAIMAIFSHGNKNVKLIDAREMFVAGRRVNSFSEKHIEEITGLYKSGMSQKCCKVLTIDDIAKNNFSLDIVRYSESGRVYKNSVKLGDIVETISRGAGCKAAELDAITSQTATPYQYLMLGDIVDGIIEEDLPYITEIPKGNERYTLKKGDVILSKMASPAKVAIVEEEHRTILASGNLYIIRLKPDTINPYYLKAYFESADGIAALSRICVGTTIPAIPVSELRELKIPHLEKEQEEEIVQKYLIATDEMKMLKRRLEKVRSSISSLFEEVE